MSQDAKFHGFIFKPPNKYNAFDDLMKSTHFYLKKKKA